jgi:hypothetical protein
MSLFDEEKTPSSTGGKIRLILLLLVFLGSLSYGLFTLLQPAPNVSEPVSSPTTPTPEPEERPVVRPPVAVEIEPNPTPSPEPTPPPPEPEPEPEPIVLRVTSDIDGADIFVDRRHVGQTPFESNEIEPGPHRINISASGYEGFVEDVTISENITEISVAFTEVRLSQNTVVVHKHRFGSCEGKLIARLDGIHYESDHADAFSVPLNQIEEFSIDYLQHTLTIRTLNSRTYNFTDNEPNADALFVFHREVARARERLKNGDQPATD